MIDPQPHTYNKNSKSPQISTISEAAMIMYVKLAGWLQTGLKCQIKALWQISWLAGWLAGWLQMLIYLLNPDLNTF